MAPALEALAHDFRDALRALRAAPGVTLAAVASLAAGIGANTAVFSLADAALWRPLPVADPDRLMELVAVHRTRRQTNLPAEAWPYLHSETKAFEGLFATHRRSLPIRRAAGGSESVPALFVSGRYFDLLGVKAAAGRLLGAADDVPDAAPVCVISHGLWTNWYGRRPDVIGESVWADGAPVTIVGVTGADFVGVDRTWQPAILLPRSADRAATAAVWVVGRLRRGVTRAEAQARTALQYQRAIAATGHAPAVALRDE